MRRWYAQADTRGWPKGSTPHDSWQTCGRLLEVRHRSAVVEYREPTVVAFPRQARGA
jgi:hypothetical protein